jgi:hypothetical protein
MAAGKVPTLTRMPAGSGPAAHAGRRALALGAGRAVRQAGRAGDGWTHTVQLGAPGRDAGGRAGGCPLGLLQLLRLLHLLDLLRLLHLLDLLRLLHLGPIALLGRKRDRATRVCVSRCTPPFLSPHPTPLRFEF